MTKIVSSFKKNIENLQLEVYQVLTQCHQVFVHRAKAAYICQELFKFHHQLNKVGKDCGKRNSTPGECNVFSELSNLMTQLHDLFISLNEESYLSTILTNGVDFVSSKMSDLEWRIAFFCTSIKIVPPSGEMFSPSPIQEQADDSADCADLLQKLNDLSEKPKELILSLEKKINDLDQISHSNHEKIDSIRKLSQEEVNKRMKKFVDWELKYEDLVLYTQNKIASGGYADVYRGYMKSTGRVVVIKKFHSTEFTSSSFNQFQREVEIMSSLKHFAILHFVGASWNHPFFIVTDYMAGNTLYERIRSNTLCPLDSTKLTVIALGIAYGMNYLHSQNMIHRNLKTANILLDADDFPRISDFATSRSKNPEKVQTPLSLGFGSAQYMAPEVLNSQTCDEKADVYSFGIMLWEMLTKSEPFKGIKSVQIAYQVIRDDARPLIPQSCSPKLSKLIKLCWDKNPEVRPDFATIAKVIETGEISFSGSSHDAVESYHKLTLNSPSILKAGNLSTNVTVDEVIARIKKDSANIVFVRPLMKDANFSIKKIIKSELIPIIVDTIRNCSSSAFAFQLLDIGFHLQEIPKLTQILIDHHYFTAIIELIMKFGTTTMENVIPCLTEAIIHEPVKITFDQYQKLSSFLIASDLNVRINTTNLILNCIEKEAYVSDSSLNAILHNVLKNIFFDAMPEIISATLKLVMKLTELPKTLAQLIKLDASMVILPICQPSFSYEIRKTALCIIKKLILSGEISNKFISKLYQIFEKLVKTDKRVDTVLDVLVILSLTLKSPKSAKKLEKSKSLLKGFKNCLKMNVSKDSENEKRHIVPLFTLQICYLLLSSSSSSSSSTQSPKLISISNSVSNSITISNSASNSITISNSVSNSISNSNPNFNSCLISNLNPSNNSNSNSNSNANSNANVKNNSSQNFNNENRNFVLRLSKNIVNLLNSDDDSIALTAASCVTRLKKIETLIDAEILKKFLHSGDERKIVAALRIIGVLATSIEGATFVRQNQLERDIVLEMNKNLKSKIKCENKNKCDEKSKNNGNKNNEYENDNGNDNKVREIAISVLSTQSSFYINSDAVIDAIPLIFEHSNFFDKNKDALVFVANCAISEKVAIQCAPYIECLLKMISVDPESCLKIIFQTYLFKKSAKEINEKEETFLEVIKKIREIDLPLTYEILNVISFHKIGRKSMHKLDMENYLIEKQIDLPIDDIAQPIIDQILDRLGTDFDKCL